ncbi:hypothetical protein PFISCL1PPCAC_6331, partial [Pristionchus fissidentatus]
LISIPLVFTQSDNFPQEEVIDLPIGRFPDPTCKYTVHSGNARGPLVHSQVRVGEPLFHSWKCSYGKKETSLYCLMVNKCTVADYREKTKKIEIIDEFGCSLFPTVLPHVSYSGDLSGGLGVNAFSLDVDQTAVFFECNIKMLLKLNGVCRRPICQPLRLFREKEGS